jgi:Na+/H+-dicarboxylate symporter
MHSRDAPHVKSKGTLMGHPSPVSNEPSPTGAARYWRLYSRTPLYIRILIALVLGIGLGLLLAASDVDKEHVAKLRLVSDLVLRLLGALAIPLIFLSVVHALAVAKATGSMGLKMTWLLMSNTVVAILIGIFVANLIQPGHHVELQPVAQNETLAQKKAYSLVDDLLGKVPGNLFKPFSENDMIAIILIALAFGIALRMVKSRQEKEGKDGFRTLENALETLFRCVMVLLHGVFHLVPLAVLAVVARVVWTQGFDPFVALAWFVLSVLLALTLMSAFYLTRLRLGSWVRPGTFLRGSSDAFAMAFSTASSAATLPVTFECMTAKIGVRERSASLGVMVGGTFNHDGTALYEAMAALFISQLIGRPLDFGAQVVVVIMSVIASVGAAGIPEAGLVTMMAVFAAVRLPIEYIPFLLAVDWFLDRCRTTINVMGDMCSTCLLDGRVQPTPEELLADKAEPNSEAPEARASASATRG